LNLRRKRNLKKKKILEKRKENRMKKKYIYYTTMRNSNATREYGVFHTKNCGS